MEKNCGGPSRGNRHSSVTPAFPNSPALALEGLGCWKVGGLGS